MSSSRHPTRTVDPYTDLDLIDARAPRFNQAAIGLLALAGAIGGWPLLWALGAAQLALGLTLGRQWCLPCLAYFELIQPRFGEGPLEDARPPRLANKIGVGVLGAAALAWWLGAETLGVALGALVAGLALTAALTGFCAGCEIYRLWARLRGIQPRHHDRIDPGDLGALNGAPRTVVQFTHPLCAECRSWERRLAAGEDPLISVDVRERPELARKYGIAIVPTIVAIAPDGDVLERIV